MGRFKGCVHSFPGQVRREQPHKLIHITAQKGPSTASNHRHRMFKEMISINCDQVTILHIIKGHLCHNANSEAQSDVGLNDIRIRRRKNDPGF